LHADPVHGPRVAEIDAHPIGGRDDFLIGDSDLPGGGFILRFPGQSVVMTPVPEMKNTSVYKGFQIRDGHGIVFVSNLGEIYPSGFLPLRCGNVRKDSLVEIYRNSEIFRALHSPDQFHGKCGACEYNHICGGSRARAFAYTGDALGTDPFCPYEPAAQPQSA